MPDPISSLLSLISSWLPTAANAAQVGDVATRGVLFTAAPVIGRRRRGQPELRAGSYLEFQQAATRCAFTAELLAGLGQATASPITQVLHQPLLHRGLERGWDAQLRFFDALQRIRLVGNPAPRRIAEEVTSLLGELHERAPLTRRPHAARRAEHDRFRECQRALGDAHRRFTIAARADIGSGPRWWRRRGPRWWRVDSWPGGWPGPDPERLIADRRPA